MNSLTFNGKLLSIASVNVISITEESPRHDHEPRQTVNEKTELHPTNANFEGTKLDMTILESRLFTALSESKDRHESGMHQFTPIKIKGNVGRCTASS